MKTKKQLTKLVIGFLLIPFLIQCSAPEKVDLKPQLDSFLDNEVHTLADSLNSDKTPGLSLIITQADSVLYLGNFGSASFEETMPITENTYFAIASVTKQFTGMAIAMLEEEGKLHPNDKIRKYLPDLSEVMDEITISHLLHHSSGIRGWPSLFAMQGWQGMEARSLDDIYNLMKKQEKLNFAPGTNFSYSNSNYNLLAMIVEEITKTPFEVWTQENIFLPLGMNNTFFAGSIPANKTMPLNSYIYNGSSYIPYPNQLSAYGSSSLISTTSDMAKWLTNFNTKQLGSDEIFNTMTHKGSLDTGKELVYGYGLYLSKLNNKESYTHDGAWAGYRSATAFIPEENMGIVILSNNGAINPQKIIKKVGELLWGSSEKESEEEEVTAQEINSSFMARCIGKYEQVDDKGCYVTFYKEGEDYFVNIHNYDLKLYAKSDSVYFVKEAPAEFVFHEKDGQINSHSLNQNGNSYLALRVDEPKKAIEKPVIDYEKLTGKYYSQELDIQYELIYKDEQFQITSPGFAYSIPLQHTEGLSFSCNSGFIQTVTFHEENGVVIHLTLDNPRSKGVVFVRR